MVVMMELYLFTINITKNMELIHMEDMQGILKTNKPFRIKKLSQCPPKEKLLASEGT
jgi:hypothetical protein